VLNRKLSFIFSIQNKVAATVHDDGNSRTMHIQREERANLLTQFATVISCN